LVDKGMKSKRARPAPLVVEVREIVRRRTDPLRGRPDARLFTGPRGGRITTAVLRDATHWEEVVTALGYEHLCRHGLRHTGLPPAARSAARQRANWSTLLSAVVFLGGIPSPSQRRRTRLGRVWGMK
jgi:integrase